MLQQIVRKSSKASARPVENGFIEGFNGGLRDECLNVETFVTQEDARAKLGRWFRDYNLARPDSALDDRTPASFAAAWSEATTEKQCQLLEALN